ncbi:endonuclease/Exonuclease/phosphatase [Apiospora saccharicola]
MESQNGEGPDGSSLKPVSSLRAQWENMNKSEEAAAPNPTPAPATAATPPPTRNLSPSPETSSSARHKTSLQLPKAGGEAESGRLGNPPPLSPRPIKPPPSVLIDPPQSPPKGRMFSPGAGPENNNQLSLDPVKSPATPTVPSPRSFKIPSRPLTPSVEPRLSPRLEKTARRNRRHLYPPPINRAEKPSNRLSLYLENGQRSAGFPNMAAEKSPFSSPPSSPERDQPPELPSRPPGRPTALKPGALARTNTLPLHFEPPPVHPSLVAKRAVQEGSGPGKAVPELAPPALPSRPQTIPDPQHPRIPATNSIKPPPRPPRAGIPPPTTIPEIAAISSQGKRVTSNPGTTQFAPPPTRTHGRSMTVDRTSERAPAEFREMSRRMNTVANRSRPAAETHNAGPTSQPHNAGPTGPSIQIITAYPDSSNVNRRPPFTKKGVHEIYTKYDSRMFDVCGQYVCTSGQLTRVWSLLDGELLMSFAHGEGVKATAVAFKCGLHVDNEGTRVWIGNNTGELMEADVATSAIIGTKSTAHGRCEIIRIYRYFNQMWTLDETGTLHVWGPDGDSGLPNLHNPPHQTYRLPKGHTFSMIAGDELWHATGREIRVFAPTLDGRTQVQVLVRPMIAEGAGEVSSGATIKTQPGKVYFGHSDGKVSIWSTKDFSCIGVLSISTWKINALAGVGSQLWAGYNTGKICAYDIEQTPWVVKKEWLGHGNPVIKLHADQASFYRLDRLQVLSLGADNMIKVWDGLLQDDFIETEMKALDRQYCEFQDIRTLCMTWNAGASTPTNLRYSEQDSTFIRNLLESSDCPDILVFGFQELVDLEDKTATAKRLFKSKKKDAVTDQERMSHQYRDWRDFLIRSLDDYMPPDCLYHLLHTSTLVGLFTCIFVRSTIRDRVTNLQSADIKRGMGGLHGNKGAIVVRFMVEDTSLCFINCHLAAGQSQANARHADIAAIVESAILPVERDPNVRIDSFMGGGDGTMVLDHELVLLNGDLNYRIDTMSRDTVVAAVKSNNLAKLLDRDQLLVARRRNPGFRLRAFDEMPIQFAPTYKYDVGTDNYDTSEKKRSPAWCDRLLHRGCGRIQQLDYRRHEVRVSDHRPVTGRFNYTIKKISPKHRAMTWADCQQRFEDVREKEAKDEKLYYLMHVLGYDDATSKSLIRDTPKRGLSRKESGPPPSLEPGDDLNGTKSRNQLKKVSLHLKKRRNVSAGGYFEDVRQASAGERILSRVVSN